MSLPWFTAVQRRYFDRVGHPPEDPTAPARSNCRTCLFRTRFPVLLGLAPAARCIASATIIRAPTQYGAHARWLAMLPRNRRVQWARATSRAMVLHRHLLRFNALPSQCAKMRKALAPSELISMEEGAAAKRRPRPSRASIFASEDRDICRV